MERGALLLVLGVVWAIAIEAWPALPERIPLHFDAAGHADGWGQKTLLVWFALPGLASVLALGLGLVLPWWMLRLARSNSPWLNVPHKKLFQALPEEARERAVLVPARWLVRMAMLVAVLFGAILYGSWQVAVRQWDRLPPGPFFGLVGGVFVLALVMAVSSSRAVRREVELANL
jgi:hypothetical protein